MAQDNPTVMYSPYGKSLNGQDPKNLAMPNAKPATTKINNNLGDSFLGPQQTNDGASAFKDIKFPDAASTFTGGEQGVMKQVGQTGMPSLQQFNQGLLHDLTLKQSLNDKNYGLNKQYADAYKTETTAAANRLLDPSQNGSKFFQDAMNFRNQGEAEARKSSNLLNSQLASADKDLDRQNAASLSTYNQAINQAGQGTDKIASAMHAAAARKTESEKDAISNEFSGALPGTDAQTADLYRAKERDLNEAVFGGVSQIQAQANNMQAQLMAGKSTQMKDMAASTAAYKATAAQAGFAGSQNIQEFKKLGSQVALANATFMFQNNTEYMNQIANIGQNHVAMMKSNPVLGAAVMPTLLAMGETSKMYGQSGQQVVHSPSYSTPGGSSGMTTPGEYALQNTLMRNNAKNYAQQQGGNYV